MAEILHKISIKAPPARVYQALATIDGLASWWTSTTSGESAPGKSITFRFGENACLMRVDALESGKRVAWEGTQSPVDWVGTKISFDLDPDGEHTTLRFAHRGWNPEASDFMSHCSMKWATFLLSLRELVETGKGRPFPHDLAV
jgi:uncharacterized protein YndB with AHSA1/START domain